MQKPKLTLQLALIMSLCVAPAFAEDFSMPDKEHRQGMSYEEYKNYREKMRLQMEKARQEEQKQAPKAAAKRSESQETTERGSAYGQGYHSRGREDMRPDSRPDNRPERPQFEKFNRGNR